MEELARVISNNNNEGTDSETPPAARSMSVNEDPDSPAVSRGTLSSLASAGSSDADLTSLQSPTESREAGDSRSGSEAGSDDLGAMEEIDVHEDSSIELRIPHSPQPSREPLPPAPFAVPSPRPQPIPLSDMADDENAGADSTPSPSSTSTALPTPSNAVEDIDPFADPNEPPAPPDLSASMTSTTLEDSQVLQAALEESVDPSMLAVSAPQKKVMPPGEKFKVQLLDLSVLNTILVCKSWLLDSLLSDGMFNAGSILRLPYE